LLFRNFPPGFPDDAETQNIVKERSCQVVLHLRHPFDVMVSAFNSYTKTHALRWNEQRDLGACPSSDCPRHRGPRRHKPPRLASPAQQAAFRKKQEAEHRAGVDAWAVNPEHQGRAAASSWRLLDARGRGHLLSDLCGS